MDMHEVVTVTRFQIRRMLRDRMTWIGLLAFVIVVAIGSWLHWQALPPRPAGSRLFGEGLVIAFVLAFNCGLARDRMSRFDVYLAANFVGPKELFVAYVATAIAMIFGAAVVGFLLNTIATLGDPQFAFRYAMTFLFASLVLLPIAMVVELTMNTRFPVPVLLLLLSILLTVYHRFADVDALLRVVGLTDQWDTAGGVTITVLRSFIALMLAFALYPLYRLRLGVRRLARG